MNDLIHTRLLNKRALFLKKELDFFVPFFKKNDIYKVKGIKDTKYTRVR